MRKKGSKIRHNTPEKRLKYCYASPENIEYIKREYSLEKIFKKHKIPIEKQQEICRLLCIGLWERKLEIKNIRERDVDRLTEKIGLKRLRKVRSDVLKLLASVPYIPMNEKENCKNIINSVVNYHEELRRHPQPIEALKKIIQKRNTKGIKKSEKDLHIYTLLIEELVLVSNVLFLEKRDWSGRKTSMYSKEIEDKHGKERIKERTFKFIDEILNAILPKLKFTPKEVKARFHK